MEWIIPAILVFLILIVIVRSINVVQQSRAYVIERLGAFSKVWQVGIHFNPSAPTAALFTITTSPLRLQWVRIS